MPRLVPLLLTALLLLGLGGCATNPVTGKADFVLMSEDQEIALGRRLHPQVLKEIPAYDDPQLAAYVQGIGERLASHSHRPGLIYRFTVLDSPDVNAFALPGGYIYIHRGLIAYLNSEAELAAVLAHEIGHVTARHAVRQQSMATATGVLGAVIAGRSGLPAAGDLANLAGTALVRGYGREHELESDRLGAEYLARSGYDPSAMLDVIRVLKAQETFERRLAKEEGREPRSYHGLFATHPDNDRRLQTVIAAAGRLTANGGRRERQTFLHAIDGLVFGDSEREGIRRGNHFYHRALDLALEFPAGWTLHNQPDRLLAIPPARDGFIQFSMTDLNRRLTPREFLIRRLGLKRLSHGEAIEHLGLPGYTAIAETDTAKGRLPLRYLVLFRGDKALLFIGGADPGGDPYRYDARVLATARRFHPLSEAEQPLARALRIRLIRAEENTRFAELARDSAIPNHPEERLRLLNGLYPDGEPRPGQWLKVVE
ncbi:M48 family metalloprotease [Thiohalobacter sp. IOR34]|uniref:M48 family metalloprotease n=1 Tax=Thiohalobacter sp. IOR34 TaxID=3057176 RepID=UPI0025B067CB|nr:M48 family metalloprotease [Thiohalobacter sp. IOR34]WJW75693.1 M48 family metalloprotease [Thiohalobacter sp. IOR34]